MDRVCEVPEVVGSVSQQGSSGLWCPWVTRGVRIAEGRGRLGVRGLREDPKVHRKVLMKTYLNCVKI